MGGELCGVCVCVCGCLAGEEMKMQMTDGDAMYLQVLLTNTVSGKTAFVS